MMAVMMRGRNWSSSVFWSEMGCSSLAVVGGCAENSRCLAPPSDRAEYKRRGTKRHCCPQQRQDYEYLLGRRW